MSTRLRVTAVHENAMLTRLTAQLGQHDVDQFSYRTTADGLAHVEVGVRGDDWQVRRVANRLRRLIGVVTVRT